MVFGDNMLVSYPHFPWPPLRLNPILFALIRSAPTLRTWMIDVHIHSSVVYVIDPCSLQIIYMSPPYYTRTVPPFIEHLVCGSPIFIETKSYVISMIDEI